MKKNLIILFVFFAIILIFIIYINADKKVLLDNSVHSDDVTKSIKEIEITDLLSQEKVFHILIKGEQFYYSTINYNNSGSKEVFFIENSNQLGFPSEVYTCDMSQREILALNTDSFNNLYLLEAYYKNTGVEYTILKISDTGALIYRNSIAIQDAPTTGGWQLTVKPDESIILYINQNIYEITSAGAINNFWVSDKDLLSIICTKNNQLFAIIYENGYKKIGELIGETTHILVQDLSTSTLELIEEDSDSILIKTDKILYRYHSKNNTKEEVLTWTDLGIDGETLEHIYLYSDGSIGGIFYDNLKNKIVNIKLNKDVINNKNSLKKQNLVIGCISENSSLNRAAARFNREHPNYSISIINYAIPSANAKETESAVNTLLNEMILGTGPDILLFDSSYLDYNQLVKKGLLEDLSPYMEKSQTIKKKDLVPSVLNILDIDNKLYLLPTNFGINTIVSKKQLIGETTFNTVKEMFSFASARNGIDNIFLNESQSTILNLLVQYDMFGQAPNNKYSFDKEQFITYLKYAEKFPSANVFNPDYSGYKKDKVFAKISLFTDVQTFMYEKSIWNDELVNIGYPKALLVPLNSMGICSKSNEKEGAWLFIEKFFTDKWQTEITPNWNFSTIEKKLNEQLNSAMDKQYYTDEFGNQSQVPILEYQEEDTLMKVYAAEQKDILMLREWIDGMNQLEYKNYDIARILEEESMAYFSGQKSAEETAAIVENRVILYLQENQ